jgi:hypothetical protein
LHGFYSFSILPEIIFQQEFIILPFKYFNDGQLIGFELLVFGRVYLIMSPLLKWNVFADKH